MCQSTGSVSGGSMMGSVDEEVKRVQAECRHLSGEIQRLQEDNRKLRVSGILVNSCRVRSDLGTDSRPHPVGPL